jgi:hypothetical protein
MACSHSHANSTVTPHPWGRPKRRRAHALANVRGRTAASVLEGWAIVVVFRFLGLLGRW